MSSDPGQLRIGEFARRVGVPPDLIRAWERRYGLLRPVRSPRSYRLYTAEDVERILRMRRELASGLSAAEAARATLDFGPRSPALDLGPRSPALDFVPRSPEVEHDAAARLLEAIEGYDEAAAHAVLDESFAALGLEGLLRDVILAALTRIGLNWEQGSTLGISQEHFASNLIRGRLLSLARLWSRGGGPLAILACPPGEVHDITLLAFGLLMRSRGWCILFLGADTPISSLTQTAQRTRPAMIVLTSFRPTSLRAQAAGLQELAKTARLVLGGPGASAALCFELGVEGLDGDLITAANDIGPG